MFPGDPNGKPGNVCNCKCFTYAVLDKEGQALENRNSRAEVLRTAHSGAPTIAPGRNGGCQDTARTPIVESQWEGTGKA